MRFVPDYPNNDDVAHSYDKSGDKEAGTCHHCQIQLQNIQTQNITI